MGRRKSQAKRREDGLKRPDEVSSGEQVVVLVLEGGEGGVGVVGAAVGCKIRMAGRPFGRMTDSTDGRVPRPSHKTRQLSQDVAGGLQGETLASTRRG